jgi:hypothetical protein
MNSRRDGARDTLVARSSFLTFRSHLSTCLKTEGSFENPCQYDRSWYIPTSGQKGCKTHNVTQIHVGPRGIYEALIVWTPRKNKSTFILIERYIFPYTGKSSVVHTFCPFGQRYSFAAEGGRGHLGRSEKYKEVL